MSVLTAGDIAEWMLGRLSADECLYQDDVVDYVVRSDSEGLLRENTQGNLVLSSSVLNAFRRLTEGEVVWVRTDKYWRYRVAEDEPGRHAR